MKKSFIVLISIGLLTLFRISSQKEKNITLEKQITRSSAAAVPPVKREPEKPLSKHPRLDGGSPLISNSISQLQRSKNYVGVSEKQIAKDFLKNIDGNLEVVGTRLKNNEELENIEIISIDKAPSVVSERMILLDLLALGLRFSKEGSVENKKITQLLADLAKAEINPELSQSKKKTLIGERYDILRILLKHDKDAGLVALESVPHLKLRDYLRSVLL